VKKKEKEKEKKKKEEVKEETLRMDYERVEKNGRKYIHKL